MKRAIAIVLGMIVFNLTLSAGVPQPKQREGITGERAVHQHFIMLNDLSKLSGQAECDPLADYPFVSSCKLKLDQPKLQACHVYWYQFICVWGWCVGDGNGQDRCEGEGYGGGGGSAF